jgi:hypothetical protein
VPDLDDVIERTLKIPNLDLQAHPAQPALVPKGGAEMRFRLPARDCPQGTGTFHHKTPFSDFSIFSLLHTFFSIFFYKIRIYDPDLAYTIKPKTLQSTLNPSLNPIS